jgi:hypothetical protein
VSECPPIPPQPSLFAPVGYDQRLEIGVNDTWPLGRPDVGSIYWIVAVILFALILLVTVWSYVRLVRSAPPGWRRRLSALLVGVGALGMLVLVGYLLLVGWPGTQLDTLWWFRASSQSGYGYCLLAVNQVDHQHTQMRDALNNRASWGLLGALTLFILGHLIPASRGASRPPS